MSSHTASPSWGRRIEYWLDDYFRVQARGSTVPVELRAGLTAFLATANNFVVNAQVMSHAGIPRHESIVSGAFAAGMACIISGVLSNLPLGLMPSVGPNVFLAYSLAASFETDQALTISGMCGALLILLSLTPMLTFTLGMLPLSIKYGLVIGTGLLTTFIALKSIQVVVPDPMGKDIVALGPLNSGDVWVAMVFLVVTTSLTHRGTPGAVLIGMLGATVVDWTVDDTWPETFFSFHEITLHKLDFSVLTIGKAWGESVALLLMLVFSTSGAIIGCARMAGALKADGGAPGSTAVYLSCGLGTMLSAALGSAPIMVSMSAASGIRDGGRTGLVSVVIGLLSLCTAFVASPLASAIPHCATAPVLILVGVSMMGEAKEVQWWNVQEALPAFLCAIFQPFTYSVSNGIYAGVAMSTALYISTGSFLTLMPESFRRCVCCSKHGGESFSTLATIKESRSDVESSIKNMLYNIPSNPGPVDEPRFACLDSPLTDAKYSSEANFVEEDGLRGALQHMAPRQKAVELLEKFADIMGLDAAEVKSIIRERLVERGARTAEGHQIGGIPGQEAAMAHRELNNFFAGDDFSTPSSSPSNLQPPSPLPAVGLRRQCSPLHAPIVASEARRARLAAHSPAPRLQTLSSPCAAQQQPFLTGRQRSGSV